MRPQARITWEFPWKEIRKLCWIYTEGNVHILTTTNVTSERLFAKRYRLRFLFNLYDSTDTRLLKNGTHRAGGWLAVVERRRDRRMMHAMIEFLFVNHTDCLVLMKLLDVIENCIDDVVYFRQRSSTASFCQECLGNRWKLIISEQFHFFNLFVRDRMQELTCVHFRTKKERFMKVPSSSNTSQKIIANPWAYLAQSICVKRWNNEDISPLNQLQMKTLLIQAFCYLPLTLVRKNLCHWTYLIDVHEVLCSFCQHDSYLKNFGSFNGEENQWTMNEFTMLTWKVWSRFLRRFSTTGSFMAATDPVHPINMFFLCSISAFSICPVTSFGKIYFAERKRQFSQRRDRFPSSFLSQFHLLNFKHAVSIKIVIKSVL